MGIQRRSFLARISAALATIPFISKAKAKMAGVVYADSVTSEYFDPTKPEEVTRILNEALQKLEDTKHVRIECREVMLSRDAWEEFGSEGIKAMRFFRIYTSGVPKIPVRDRNAPQVSVAQGGVWVDHWTDF